MKLKLKQIDQIDQDCLIDLAEEKIYCSIPNSIILRLGEEVWEPVEDIITFSWEEELGKILWSKIRRS